MERYLAPSDVSKYPLAFGGCFYKEITGVWLEGSTRTRFQAGLSFWVPFAPRRRRAALVVCSFSRVMSRGGAQNSLVLGSHPAQSPTDHLRLRNPSCCRADDNHVIAILLAPAKPRSWCPVKTALGPSGLFLCLVHSRRIPPLKNPPQSNETGGKKSGHCWNRACVDGVCG